MKLTEKFEVGDRVKAYAAAGYGYPDKPGTVVEKKDNDYYRVRFDHVNQPVDTQGWNHGGYWDDDSLVAVDDVAVTEQLAVFYKGGHCVNVVDRVAADTYIATGVINNPGERSLADYEVRTRTVRTTSSPWVGI